jgi:hypothetical protein
MKKRYAIIPISLCVLAALYIISCSHHSTVTHAIGGVTAAPSEVPAGIATQVTVTAKITDPAVVSGTIRLLRIASDGTQTDVGALNSAGNDNYSIQFPINEPAPGQTWFSVVASFQGSSSKVISTPVSVVSLVVPSGFKTDPGPLTMGGPLSLDNFGSAYEQGGVIPAGGASIDATVMPLPNGPLNDYIAGNELQGALIQGTSTVTVSSVSCQEVKYLDVYTPTLSYGNDAVYCPSGALLYKFFLSYNDDDPNASIYESAFQQVVNSAVLSH